MKYQLTAINYYELDQAGNLGPAIITVDETDAWDDTWSEQYTRVNHGYFYQWHAMSTGKEVREKDHVYNFLVNSVEKSFKGQLAIVGGKKPDDPVTKAVTQDLQENSRFSNIER